MKRLSFLILIPVAVMLFVSCKKYLTSDSPSEFTPNLVFGTEDDARKAVNSVYALFNQDAFTSRVSNIFTGNTDIECGGVGASPDNSRRDIWSFETTSGNADLLTVWNNAYKAINLANECEEGLKTVSLAKDPGNKNYKQLLGEAKTLRSIWYYLLMNHWGDVPFTVKPSRAGDNFYLGRTGRDSILTFLINDLREIEPDMQWADQLTYGIEQVNREFVMGMIARLSLMRGGYWMYPDKTMKRKADYLDYYKIANDYSKRLVQLKPHTLGDFSTVFMNENKYIKPANDDVLYEVAFYPGSGDVAWCNGVRVDGGSHPYGSGSNYLSFPITYYHSFDTTDLRLPVTCAIIYWDKDLIQQATGAAAIAPGKWNRMLVPAPLGAASSKGTGINWPMMRYSDVLLMLAESENEINGPTSVAQDALKQVRKRAFPSSLWSTKVDGYVAAVSGGKDPFFNAIVNERAWEFGGECLRKYDLERWNLFGKKVAETRNTLAKMGEDGVNSTGIYGGLPDYLYYKRDAGGVITWLNKYTKVAVEPPVVDVPNKGDNPNGYLRVSWTRAMWNTTTNAPADFVVREWRGYTDNTGSDPLRYILPLHSSVISSSQGALQQQYGYQ